MHLRPLHMASKGRHPQGFETRSERSRWASKAWDLPAPEMHYATVQRDHSHGTKKCEGKSCDCNYKDIYSPLGVARHREPNQTQACHHLIYKL